MLCVQPDRSVDPIAVSVMRDITHRLLFCPGGGMQEHMVDLLPCGGIEQPTHTIAWPPDMQMLMSVAGDGDALKTAPLVQVATGLMIRIVSLPGLAMLKLFAWKERGMDGAKDAIDLVTLYRCYAEVGSLDRLYEEGMPALQSVDFDVELAGAWLLGKDVAATTSQQTHDDSATLSAVALF